MRNTNETGRSMVEMLGVLAIIGVLSIGGIAGYTLAMNRYRANEILNAVSLVAIAATSKNGGAGDNANLQDVGGLNSFSLPAIDNDNGIRATNTGIVTVEVNYQYPKVANLVKSLSGRRVVNGAGFTNTTCSSAGAGCRIVINMGAKI